MLGFEIQGAGELLIMTLFVFSDFLKWKFQIFLFFIFFLISD